MKLPSTWLADGLANFCQINPRHALPIFGHPDDDFEVSFIPMSAVDETVGAITKPVVRRYGDVSKGYTGFLDDDVLFAKVTPCMENGKVAVASNLIDGFGFGSTEFHVLRANTELLPEYLYYFIKQKNFRDYAASAFIGTGGLQRVPQDFLARVKLPLPTLPEQERIVAVLGQAEALVNAKKNIAAKLDTLIQTLYWEYFGNWYSANGLVDPVRISEYVEDSQYGVSESMGEVGSHAVLRMNSISESGWFNFSELKYASLSDKDIASTELKDGDILFNRTNSKELVGKCAIWRTQKEPYSFASYLVRFRLKKGMLPEYLWATLNSEYGKYRLTNIAKQAVSMANISPPSLGRITVPLPPLDLQIRFSKIVREIEKLRDRIQCKVDAFENLREIATQNAFAGELTAKWREANQTAIQKAAKARNARLGKGLRVTKATDMVYAPPPYVMLTHAGRVTFELELSDFQRHVFHAFAAYPELPLFAEDEDKLAAFVAYLRSYAESDGMGFSNNHVQRVLGQLAAFGLIGQMSLRSGAAFLKAFRLLRTEERVRLSDLEQLNRDLALEEQAL
jgi:type I restriction enzyme, S subunit